MRLSVLEEFAMSEPKREVRYPKLHSLKQRLQRTQERDEPTVEASLIVLVDGLEEAAYRVAQQTFLGENFDNYADLRNLAKLKRELHDVAVKLESALECRNAFFR